MPTLYRQTEGSYGGDRWDEFYFVDGLTRSDAGAQEEALSVGGLPVKGDLHPFRSGFKVETDPEVVQMWERCARIRVGYGPGPDPGASGGAEYNISHVTSVIDVETWVDAEGNPILVGWQRAQINLLPFVLPPGVSGPTTGSASTPGVKNLKNASTTMKAVTSTLTFTRQVSRYDSATFARHFANVGKTNKNAPWQGIERGGWLCSQFSHVSADKGRTWTETIEFTFIEQGWNQIVAFIREDTGAPPQIEGVMAVFQKDRNPRIISPTLQVRYNGYTVVQVQGEADFNQLGLPDISRGRRGT